METGKSAGSMETPGTANTGSMDTGKSDGTVNTGSMDTGKSAGSVETLELLTQGPWILANPLDLWKPWNCEHRVHEY